MQQYPWCVTVAAEESRSPLVNGGSQKKRQAVIQLRLDQGSSFTSIRGQGLCDMDGTELRCSIVKSHNSLGRRERYHCPLPQVYLKIRHEHSLFGQRNLASFGYQTSKLNYMARITSSLSSQIQCGIKVSNCQQPFTGSSWTKRSFEIC